MTLQVLIRDGVLRVLVIGARSRAVQANDVHSAVCLLRGQREIEERERGHEGTDTAIEDTERGQRVPCSLNIASRCHLRV